MEFRILGPLRVLRSGAPVAVTGRHHPKALALLVEDANRVVPVDRLIGALWEGTLPDTAEQQVLNVISGLRRALGPDGERLTRVGRGYRLEAAAEEVDLLRCKAIVAEARLLQQSGRDAAAIEAFRKALAEWDGPSLAGLSGRSIEALAERLDDFRLSIVEERIALELEAGQGEDLIVELRGLLAEHPLRQRLAEQLMLALHRAGRAPEALQVFADVREELATAYGIDPGPALRQLHLAILREDPALHRPRAARPDRPVPAMLPGAVRGFTGRADSLNALDDLLADGPGLAAITGTGGIGKSTLAAHWAHRVADRFPDGQLYLDLRGFDPSGHPLTAAEALGSLLEALGVPAGQAPSDETARIGLYRSLIANRRILVVLDNARDAAHVRSLIPGGTACFTVVTSRDRLAGLAAAQGARPVPLAHLDDTEANELLERRLGSERLRAEPEAAQLIIAACAGLPLALAIASARAATRPDFPLETIAAELRDARANLDAFAGDDPATDARTVFSWSYRALTADAARMFRLFGLHPGPDCSLPAAAGLAAVPTARARVLLSELTSAHLIDEHRPGRFRCHDLLRVYAAELVAGTDETRTATERMLDHYLCNAQAAANLTDPGRDTSPVPPNPNAVQVERFDEAAAKAWHTAELAVLLAAVHLAAARGFDRHAWQLAWNITNVAYRQGRWHEGVAAVEAGLEAAVRIGDTKAQFLLHRNIARCRFSLGDRERSFEHLDRALELCGDDQELLAGLHRSYGRMYGQMRRYSDALEHGVKALRIYQELGHVGEALLLNAVGWYHAQLGNFEEALVHCRQSLERYEQVGDRISRAHPLDSIGFTYLRMGDPKRALPFQLEAAQSFRDDGDRPNEADTLVTLGETYVELGRPDEARAAWRRAFDLVADVDPPIAACIADKLRKLDESQDPAPDT